MKDRKRKPMQTEQRITEPRRAAPPAARGGVRAPSSPSASAHRPERTCVGCRKAAPQSELVRLVVAPSGEIVPDLHQGSFGRGAWVHPWPECVARAPGGLGRTLRRPVSTSGAALHAALCEASGRRLLGLLLAAARTKRLAVGSLAVRAALEANEAEIIVVATDARAAAHTSWVEAAVAAGRAVAFGTKDQLGKLLSRDEAGVLAVLDAGMARALRRAAEIAQMAAPATGSKRERAGDRRLDE